MSGRKVAVILSGCGVYDGAEIHEATLTLLALDRAGATAIMAAPDKAQARVVNHATGAEMPESRNCLAEAARIARGKIRPLSELKVADVDAVILPGGFGAALNLSNLASAGADLALDPGVATFLGDAKRAGKPIAALCIAPPLLARVLTDAGIRGARLTIGDDPGTAAAIVALGQVHVVCPADSCVVDAANRIVTCPAYMTATGIAQLWTGIEKAVNALLAML